MADPAARKRAEEALAADCDPYTSCMDEGQSCHHRMADALRAFLAETAADDDEVHRERDLLRERLDQFEAYGFPNVATLLDRLAEERRRRAGAERKLRHLCYVYGCTSHGRTPDHGPDDCAWCEAEALLAGAPLLASSDRKD